MSRSLSDIKGLKYCAELEHYPEINGCPLRDDELVAMTCSEFQPRMMIMISGGTMSWGDNTNRCIADNPKAILQARNNAEGQVCKIHRK